MKQKAILLQKSDNVVKGTHITFIRRGMSESGKTMRWEVDGEALEILGWVKWYGPWRTYAFDAESNMVFEKTCLREIAQFCENLTNDHFRNLRWLKAEVAEIHNQPSKNP